MSAVRRTDTHRNARRKASQWRWRPPSHSNLDQEKAGIQINPYSSKCKGDIALLPLRRPLRRCGASPRLQTAAVSTEPARQAFLADAADRELGALVAVTAGGLRGRPFYRKRRRHPLPRKDAALWDRKIRSRSLAHTTHRSVLCASTAAPERSWKPVPLPPHTHHSCSLRSPNNRALPVLLDFIGICLV